ncbi:MAG: hypothetical protein IJV24_04670 [Prevotella sp.]|nr:hypothetical protein [Prevotella sp.]
MKMKHHYQQPTIGVVALCPSVHLLSGSSLTDGQDLRNASETSATSGNLSRRGGAWDDED